MSTWIAIAPLVVLAIGALITMVVDSFGETRQDLALMTFVLLVVAGGTSLALLTSGAVLTVPTVVSDYLACDSMALFFDVVVCGGAALTALLAGGYLHEHELERGEYYVLLLLSVFGALVLARAVDLLSLFIGLETMSLGAYCLIAFRRRSARAAEAAVKYFLLGSFAAALLLFGAALLYGATGETNLAAIGRVVHSLAAAPGESVTGAPALMMLGMLLVLVGLAFKVSAVPFHMWTPDAYEGAPTPTTTFMAVAVKGAAFAVLLRVLWAAFGDAALLDEGTGWPPLLAGLAVLSMVVGNFAALMQSNVKRMLAYSSIAHAGYLLVGVVATFREREAAMTAVMFYILAYTVSSILAFGALILAGSRGSEVVSFEDLAGLGRRHPWASVPLLLGTLTLMGFPPTAGFFAKYAVFNVAVHGGGMLLWLAIIGVLTSAVGAYYYLKVIVFMYMKVPQPGAPIAVPMRNFYVIGAVVLASYFVCRMGLAPGAYLDVASEAARQFFSALPVSA